MRALCAGARIVKVSLISLELERSQEIQQVLLIRFRKLVEIRYDCICFRRVGRSATAALMLANRSDQVIGAAVMQEEDALTKSPQGRCTELARPGLSLTDSIGEIGTHIVDQQIRVEVCWLIAEYRDGRLARHQCRRVALRAADHAEQVAPPGDRGRATQRS